MDLKFNIHIWRDPSNIKVQFIKILRFEVVISLPIAHSYVLCLHACMHRPLHKIVKSNMFYIKDVYKVCDVPHFSSVSYSTSIWQFFNQCVWYMK